ncbi:MAG: hypothetical protein R8J85_10330, partial [Mariprofundales bacterium]
TARSQYDIQHDMYARPDGSETGLLGYWNFDDPGKAFAATAIDLTANANDATLGDGTLNNILAPVSVVNDVAYSFAPSTIINMRATAPVTISLIGRDNTTPTPSTIISPPPLGSGFLDQFVAPIGANPIITPFTAVTDGNGRTTFDASGAGTGTPLSQFDFNTFAGGNVSPTHTIIINAR